MELEIRGRETVTLDRRPRAPLTPVDTPTWHNPLWPSYRSGRDSFSSLTFNANVAWVLADRRPSGSTTLDHGALRDP